MENEKYKAYITLNSGSEITIEDDKENVMKILTCLGEFFYNNGNLDKENLDTLVDIGEYLRDGTPENVATAKKFFEAAEKFFDPRASDDLSDVQENPLIAEAMWLRAADRNAPAPLNNLQEDYDEQANYWRKKIAEAEGQPFEGNAPTDKEILESSRLIFFNIYTQAFAGDPKSMKLCLEFCEKEAEYWKNRE